MNRLVPARDVDDRQPPHRKAGVLVHVETVLVRAAVNDRGVHPFEYKAIDDAFAVVNKTGYSAHLMLMGVLETGSLSTYHFLYPMLLDNFLVGPLFHKNAPSDRNEHHEKHLY